MHGEQTSGLLEGQAAIGIGGNLKVGYAGLLIVKEKSAIRLGWCR